MIAPKICYISPYPVLTSLLEHCFEELPSPPKIEQSLPDAETVGDLARERGFEVFVTTENNARYLRTKLDIPIVVIAISPFDTVYALKKAVAEHGQPVALFQFRYHNPLLPAFEEIVGCDIREFVFQDNDDGRAKLIEAKEEGFRAIRRWWSHLYHGTRPRS